MDYSTYFKEKLNERIREFESNLLIWMRGDGKSDAMTQIENLLTYMQAMERRGGYRRLWWLGSGLAEAINRGDLECNDDTRHLFAELVNTLKHLHSDNGKSRPDPPAALFDDLVNTLKLAGPGGPIMENIARQFHLFDNAS
ncbi:MAG: hypothetical protein DHS20C01_04320 [marine bacterium B5-7]|nr:MAG: hypothetical protein DHS20C01_04320 [marine bacterium B5-7]